MNESKEQDSYIDPLNVPSWVSEDVHSIPLPTVLIPKAGSHIKGDFDDILTNESKPLFIKKQNQRKSIGSVTIDVQSGDHVSRNICCCFPKCDIVLVAFQLFHFIAGVIAIGSLVDNFYVLSKLEKHTQESTREIILRIYCLFFSISLVIIETEYEYLNNFFALFRQWFFRGLWYIFIGTLTCKNSFYYFS